VVIRQAAYRARQFLRALTARLAVEDLEEARRTLAPAQWELFSGMSAADRRHAVAVYRALGAQGARSPDLLVAALLHDVGKSLVPASLWVRVTVVLLERFVPHLLEGLSRGEARGWRRAFVLYRRHAEVGAERAAQAGCSSCTVALILRHEERMDRPKGEEDRLLALLQAADGRS
jgi:predicted HD phosphohydrolase